MRRRSRSTGPDDAVVIPLTVVEVDVLGGLIDELDLLAQDPPAGDPVTNRLFPPGYEDAAAAQEFGELTRESLQRERHDRYEKCRTQLPVGGGELVIDTDSVEGWLIVLNDMRLALGTRLGVTADGFDDHPDQHDQPDQRDQSDGPDGTGGERPGNDVEAARIAYNWLTAVQDQLVTSVMR